MTRLNNIVVPSETHLALWQNIVTWILRISVGGLFLYSGFVKGIDPWGTFYKLAEYAEVLKMSIPDGLIISGVFILFGYEFLTGFSLLTGSYRRSSPIMALLLMAVMLPLTLWIAISNPVSDCGCFGDALKISNWATFWKNVVLTIGILWLIKFNLRSYPLITPSLQWLGFVFSATYIMFIGIMGYFYQPLIDFRNYPVGSHIAEATDVGDDDSAADFVFKYRKGNEERYFSADDELPDEESGWVFVERVEVKKTSVGETEKNTDNMSDSSDFAIYDIDSHEDVTSEILSGDGSILMAVIPELDNVSTSSAWMLNTLSQWGNVNGVKLIAVVAGSDKSLENWEDLAMPDYEIYRSDDTMIKEIARGNPGIIYIENGIIRWKNTLWALPMDESADENIKYDYRKTQYNPENLLSKSSGCFIAVVAVLMALSLSTKFKRRRSKTFSDFLRKDKSTDIEQKSE